MADEPFFKLTAKHLGFALGVLSLGSIAIAGVTTVTGYAYKIDGQDSINEQLLEADAALQDIIDANEETTAEGYKELSVEISKLSGSIQSLNITMARLEERIARLGEQP